MLLRRPVLASIPIFRRKNKVEDVGQQLNMYSHSTSYLHVHIYCDCEIYSSNVSSSDVHDVERGKAKFDCDCFDII